MLCRLTVRGSDAVRQWDIPEWTALAVIASLSAAPKTLDELMAALQRYQPDHQLVTTGRDVSEWVGCCDAEMWCVIDLVGKTMMGGGEFQLPDLTSAYEPSPGEEFEGFPLVWLDTPRGWSFEMAKEGWQAEVARRAAAEQAAPKVDARPVLYERPLLEFLVDQMLAVADDYQRSDGDGKLALTRDIHARWLMTPRDDLAGCSPRQILLADREQIDSDIEHRSRQWTRQGHSPPPLSRESDAYQFGGFGITHAVTYFELVRQLMDRCWELIGHKQTGRSRLIEALIAERDRWMAEPFEGSGPTVSALLDLERRRMPVTADAGPLDCDCPICRAEAEGVFGSSPGFMFFDGHRLNLEEMFAFSLEEDYRTWQLTYDYPGDWDRHDKPVKTPCDEADVATDDPELASTSKGERVDKSAAADSLSDSESVWKSSYVNWNQVAGRETSPIESLLALSFPLAEIITNLKSMPQGQAHVDELNESYDTLRRSSDRIAAQSAARHFCETLEKTCGVFPDLTPKCADLQSHVDEMLRRLA